MQGIFTQTYAIPIENSRNSAHQSLHNLYDTKLYFDVWIILNKTNPGATIHILVEKYGI
jgi:hypothetical protein